MERGRGTSTGQCASITHVPHTPFLRRAMKPQPSMAPPSASYLDQRRRQTGFVPRLELEPPDVAPSPPQPKARSAASPLITLCTRLNHESKRLKVMQRGFDPSDAQSRGMAHMDLGLPGARLDAHASACLASLPSHASHHPDALIAASRRVYPTERLLRADVYSYMYSFPYDDEFLAPGKEVMCCRDWVACTRDACYGEGQPHNRATMHRSTHPLEITRFCSRVPRKRSSLGRFLRPPLVPLLPIELRLHVPPRLLLHLRQRRRPPLHLAELVSVRLPDLLLPLHWPRRGQEGRRLRCGVRLLQVSGEAN